MITWKLKEELPFKDLKGGEVFVFPTLADTYMKTDRIPSATGAGTAVSLGPASPGFTIEVTGDDVVHVVNIEITHKGDER